MVIVFIVVAVEVVWPGKTTCPLIEYWLTSVTYMQTETLTRTGNSDGMFISAKRSVNGTEEKYNGP